MSNTSDLAACPFCGRDVDADLVTYGGKCPHCFGEIPGEEAPTDPGEEKKAADIDAGVRVIGVDGPAARAGVQVGDIVLSVNSHRIRKPEDLREGIGKIADGSVAALLVLREDAQIFIPVRIRKATEE